MALLTIVFTATEKPHRGILKIKYSIRARLEIANSLSPIFYTRENKTNQLATPALPWSTSDIEIFKISLAILKLATTLDGISYFIKSSLTNLWITTARRPANSDILRALAAPPIPTSRR